MNISRYKLIFFMTMLLGYLCIVIPCYADTVNTELSRDKVAMGEMLTISFTLKNGAKVGTPDFSPFAKDFRVLNTNYGNSISVINGVATTKTFWRLTVEPIRTGVLTIPKINFGSDQSATRQLTVEKATSYSASTGSDKPAFIQAELSSTSPYIQSQVIYKVKLFYQTNLQNPRIEVPQIKDATFIQLGEGAQYDANINGKPFSVVEKNFALFPQKTGKILIPATHLSALTMDLSASFMGDPFTMSFPKQISLSTKELTLNALPVPGNYDGTTWLPAKTLALTEKWSVDPSLWEEGSPVTRTINVEAEGLRADQIPDFSIDKISGVNVYIDPPKRSNEVQGNAIIGTLTQKVTYIPNTSSSFTVAGLKLNWWNVATNTNAVAQLDPVSIHIKIKPSTNNSQNISNSTTKPLANTKAGFTAPSNNMKDLPFYSSIWFWIAVSLLLLWLATIGLIWNKKRSKKNLAKSSEIDDGSVSSASSELSEENFKEACEHGNAALAQQYLLSWAKKQWPEKPLNLEKLRDIINDETFKVAIEDLEQGIYAKHSKKWDGRTLLASYQQVKRNRKHSLSSFMHVKNVNYSQQDPLPPLNPK